MTKFTKGKHVNLQGFTSTSQLKEKALSFALFDITAPENKGKVSVLFQISFKGNQQFFSLNSRDYSAYPHEEEILIQEGIKFKVIDIVEKEVVS